MFTEFSTPFVLAFRFLQVSLTNLELLQYPILWDVLGFPSVICLPLFHSSNNILRGSFPNEQTTPLYFDRKDVKKVLHVPTNVKWEECSSIDVFPHGDASPESAWGVLPKVIDKNERTVVLHGHADYILISDGYVVFPEKGEMIANK
jgi:carboxypeptidase D